MSILDLPFNRLACSIRTATLCSHLSSYAYGEKEQVSANLNQFGLSLVSYFDVDGIQGFIAKDDKIAFLIFRGTDLDVRDFAVDLSFFKIESGIGKVHKGFYEAFKKIQLFVEFDLKELKLPLIVSGHSLGGALAIMATRFLDVEIRDRISSIYTFGAPGVGDYRFESACMELPLYKFVHKQDIVSRVPFFMKKPGTLYFSSGEKIERGNTAYWSYMGNNLLSMLQILELRYSKKIMLDRLKSTKPMFDNHGIQNYVDLLENHLKANNQAMIKMVAEPISIDL
ncbi:MAG: lipase family protein [Bacteriovorax sp.]|nr:lipase family protein [Bacteriovorax sp.]